MSAATSEKRSHDGTSPTCEKDSTRKKKAQPPGTSISPGYQVTLPPICPDPRSPSAVLVGRRLFSPTAILHSVTSDRPLSVVELPHLIARVGRRKAIADTKWPEGPRPMASALCADIPVRAPDTATVQSSNEKDESFKVTTSTSKSETPGNDWKTAQPIKAPHTGMEVLQMFLKKRGDLELYYLKEIEGDSYRPYDLGVVDRRDAGSEHYIFSPSTVLHVTERGCGGLVSLADWYRESVLWTALQEIPFFREFRIRKAFTWWNKNVRKRIFERKCEDLQGVLLAAVPQYRKALFLLSSIIEELRGWLPQDETKTYTLVEFKNVLETKKQECQQILGKLSWYHSAILKEVKEDSYKTHQELRLHIEYSKRQNKYYEPIHLYLAHQQELKKEFVRAESILQKLGNFAALVRQMIVQGLVTTIRQDAKSFLCNVLKRERSQAGCLFQTDLCFSDGGQLTLDPPTLLFQEAVSEALLTVGGSLCQMCDTCGFFLEVSSSVVSSGSADVSYPACPSITEEKKVADGKFHCCQRIRDQQAHFLVPSPTAVTPRGNRARGCYYPMSQGQLMWHVSINDVSKQVEKELTELMKEAQSEIQELCEEHTWLVDVYLFLGRWSGASLEHVKGQRAAPCEEDMKKVHQWAERIHTVPSSISTSSQLFIINCNSLKEDLGQQLSSIEKYVQVQHVEQIKLQSQSLVSELERAIADLRTEPQDLQGFSKYALTVRESVKMLPDMQERLEYVHSLRDNVHVTCEEDLSLEQKMLGLWDCLVARLKQANRTVSHRLPPMANALDTMFRFLACDLKNMVSNNTSGPVLDPNQHPEEMVSRLSHMYAHVETSKAKLEQLCRTSATLREDPMDLSVPTADIDRIRARKELWELVSLYRTWLQEWKTFQFSEVAVSQAQEKIAKWQQQVEALTSIISPCDAVLQEASETLEKLSRQLAVLAKLQSPALRHDHLSAIFQGLGLLPEENVTVAQLMSQQLEVHQELINKICREAQAERAMEQTFHEAQQEWRDRRFQLEEFTVLVWQEFEHRHTLTEKSTAAINPNTRDAYHKSFSDVRFIFIGLQGHSAEVEHDLMTLSNMLRTTRSDEFRLQVEEWMRSLQELEKLIDLLEKYQKKWTFLIKMFYETSLSGHRVDLLQRFQSVDETFKSITHFISTDPHVLKLVHPNMATESFHGNHLCESLINGVSTMEAISNQFMDLRDSLCEMFPRLWFLSDREVMELLSFHPTPSALLPFVRRFFKGVHQLEVDRKNTSDTTDLKGSGATCDSLRQRKVLGVYGSLQENITFLSPLEPNHNTLVWLSVFEEQLKLTMELLLKQCVDVRNQLEPSNKDLASSKRMREIILRVSDGRGDALPVLDMVSKYPLQCLLVAEEAKWCSVALQAFQNSSPVELSNIKAYACAQLKHLGQSMRGKMTESKSESVVSRYVMMCLCALVQLTMKHAEQTTRLTQVQCEPESSFEWLSVMKYRVNSGEQSRRGNSDSTLHVDVLGRRLQYGFEYFGPEDWMMVHTPCTDRGMMGILLALTSYRCGLVSGPCMSGKTKTVVQLGRALGRQVVTLQCCPLTNLDVVSHMLLGALHTGACLLLDSVDLLTQRAQASLAQHLEDIHHSFSELTRKKEQSVNVEPEDTTADGVTCCNVVLSGKSVSAWPSFGCVLISSKGYASEVTQSLLFSTRPVALTHPDYRTIAEVLLTSIGFSEASSLSLRLVSLIRLAKDSACLPDSITEDQSCYLIVLQKIISASEIHLQQSVRERDVSDKANGSAPEQTDLPSPENVTSVHKDREEDEEPPRRRSSRLSVIQGLMEETAVVKGILSVLSPIIYVAQKASQFYSLFKDTFPVVCQFPLFHQLIEEEEKKQLKEAITEELERKLFQSDTETVSNVLKLYQTMKSSQPVMLVGPSGSGKTTCCTALAGALNSLTTGLFAHDTMIVAATPQAKPQISEVTWSFVDTVVLFPNAMSHEEMFGFFCEKRGWQDGAVGKLLRDSGRHERACSERCNKKKLVKWLIMDGEPDGQPGWLDLLSTLSNLEDPFLCLSSGEMLPPSRSHLKLLIETTDLSHASPSAVTRCSLAYFTGTDLWKSVWKSELDSLQCEHRLNQGTLKMWDRLAEDLFSSTLSSLKTDVIPNKGESGRSSSHGLQEITSFIRILRALLQHFGTQLKKQLDIQGGPLQAADTDHKLKEELFLVAYIWGFGGHLHPDHWPRFDVIARRVLLNSRYTLVVPDEETVFEHFFNVDSRMYPRNTVVTNSITLKYRKHTQLLTLMLEANQPALLAGEQTSGKTALCNTLLCFDRPHVRLPASSLLSSRELRGLLSSISQKTCKDSRGRMSRKPRLLLFVDDLHEAPRDVFGKTSKALETLRQSISKGGILTFDAGRFESSGPQTVGYLATCCVFELDNHHGHVISPRLSRLYSIFVLPSLTLDTILSIRSPQLKLWLKEVPLMQDVTDMVSSIVTATKYLYHSVCNIFQPTQQRPYLMFSHHDLQKVFQGMCLWQPNIPCTETPQVQAGTNFPPVLQEPGATVRSIVHLWMHECMRTFSDRLSSGDEHRTLRSLTAEAATTHYGIGLLEELNYVSLESAPTPSSPVDTAASSKPVCHSPDTLKPTQELKPAGQPGLRKCITSTEPSSVSGKEILKMHPLQPQILQQLEDVMAKLEYGPELTEACNSTYQQPNFKCSSAYQGRDLNMLVQQLSALLDRHEDDRGGEVPADHSVTSKYEAHKQRVRQVLHVLRALVTPGGHGVLIGSDRGTGRKTTVRLAAYVTGFHLMEMHPGNENKVHEILKEAGNQARVEGVHVILLVHEDVSSAVRDALLVAMARRSYPGIHTEEELRNLVSRVTAVKNSRRYLMDCWMFEKNLSRIHRNVHVFLLMSSIVSDSSETPANNGVHTWTNTQMTKALNLSCCVEVYKPWSNQSLVAVAARRLNNSSHSVLSVAMAGIHQSACQHAAVLLTAQPFSPQTYMEFISHFENLCKHLQKRWQGRANRCSSVLAALDVLSNTAVRCKQDLIRQRETLAETQQREEKLLKAVNDQKCLLKEARRKCAEEEKKLCHLEDKISHSQREVRTVFLSGVKILQCLNPLDLEEVRHYRDPPEGVVKVMDAICLLFNRPPGWESAKQLIGKVNFFQELEFFDRFSLTNEQLQQLGQIVQSPLFVPESVREVSQACESLCRWVQAVYECCCVQRKLLDKQQLEVVAGDVHGQLHLAKKHKEDANRRVEDVKLQLQFVQKTLEEQLLQLHKAESVEREAADAVGQLERHVRDWRAAAQEAELHEQTSPGDALILAAIISYLGPFAPDVRTELLSKWRELCQTGSIDTNPKDPRTSLFTNTCTAAPQPTLGFPIAVSERLQLPLGQAVDVHGWQLPQDDLSARLVVKLLLWGCRRACVQRWPLLADTQNHVEINWLITGDKATLEMQLECVMVVCADDPKLLDKLDKAAEEGLRVLVTHVERVIPTPQLLARLTRPSGCRLPGSKQNDQLTHPDFCLFFSTHLPVWLLGRDIHPSILARLSVVDLSLSSEEIQELMLTQLLKSECKELLTQHLRLHNDEQLLQKKLATEEDALMDHILQSGHHNTLLLQESDFLPRVAACQEAMNKLRAEIQQLREGLEYHESLLAVPRQLLTLAAALYQALQEVSRLSPAYCFSLPGFITMMHKVFIDSGRPLVSYAAGRDGETDMMKRMVAQLLVHYRPCLFKSHAAALKLLVSLALLQHSHLCSEAEKAAFLMGLEDIPNLVTPPATASQSSVVIPSWISPHIHPELLRLERVPAFTGLMSSLATSPTQWQEYLRFPSSTVAGAVPCRSHSHLSLLQRALLWKTLLPECLAGVAEALAACHLCLPVQTAATDEAHSGNPEALSRYVVTHEGPIILTLPRSGKDKWTSIQPLHLIKQLACCAAETKEVKVISFGGLCDRHLILSTLDTSVKDGHWLVFNNCHLLDRWDDEVVAHLHQLTSSVKERRIHSGFRLWFISEENATSFIPVAVRMCALPLVCDSAWDVKEELSGSLRQVVSIMQHRQPSGVTADIMELLLRCTVFHCVLLQRQNSKHSGRGRTHCWSQADLVALVDALVGIASLCHDKIKALQYVAVNLVHGGHVLESAELEVVKSVAESFLSAASPLSDVGAHILSDIISSTDPSDLSELLQVLERRLQDSEDVSDQLVLRFSAAVASEMITIDSHNLNILLQASQTPLGRTQCSSIEMKLSGYNHARDRLQALQSYLTHKSDGGFPNADAVYHSPLRDFLQAEWDDLIESVSSLLSQLQQPFQYSTPITASFHQLTDLSLLERRAELLCAYLWHRDAPDQCGAYRLSAFKNARGVLVAVMREAAHRHRKYISDIDLHFEVVRDGADRASTPPGAVYLCGLELRGASWDKQTGALQHTVAPQPCLMPLVCVKAKIKDSRRLRDTSKVHVPDAPPPPACPFPVYHCPLYLEEAQDPGDGRLADIITTVPLHTNFHPVLCSLRRVRLVSRLCCDAVG